MKGVESRVGLGRLWSIRFTPDDPREQAPTPMSGMPYFILLFTPHLIGLLTTPIYFEYGVLRLNS